ncbi:MAG: VCBS repeat-containing protein [Phycisphaerae bacterium]|nr:VCBS repeat-containing protein [Phycisphaerae bacterium]
MQWVVGFWTALFAGIFTFIGCPGTNPTSDWTAERLDNSPSTQPAAVEVADMDGDGAKDVVSVWQGSSSRVGVAAIHFQVPGVGWTTSVIDSGARYAAASALNIADVNLDSHLDVVVANGDRITYLRSPANPRVVTEWQKFDIAASINSNYKEWFDVAAVQIDGKNGLDIFATLHDVGRLVWFESPANPDSADGWVIHSIDSTTRSGADSLIPIDMNGDGKIDVVNSASNDTNGTVSWYEQPADPTTTPWSKHVMTTFSGATRIAMGDLTGNGQLDLVAISPKQRKIAWFPRPADVNASWNGWVLADYTTDSSDTRKPYDVAIADMDGDGRLEVVVLSNNPASIYWYSPGSDNTALWNEHRITAISPNGFGLFAVNDVMGRGRNDVIVPIVQDDDATQDRISRLINPLP